MSARELIDLRTEKCKLISEVIKLSSKVMVLKSSHNQEEYESARKAYKEKNERLNEVDRKIRIYSN